MKINDNVLKVLSNSSINNNVLKINSGQLDRKLYINVNKILEVMGGKWNRKFQGHVFTEDPTDSLEQVLLTGEILLPQKFGYFPTPLDLAKKVVELADIKPGMMVLEPSAGQGSIALEAKEIVGKNHIECYELLEDNCNVLRKLFNSDLIHQADFLTISPYEEFDRVVMNPPFEKQADIDHVTHAFKFLKPGGKLVSIMSSSIIFRENTKTVKFRETFKPEIIKNPEGSFKISGTMVNTVIVIINKD